MWRLCLDLPRALTPWRLAGDRGFRYSGDLGALKGQVAMPVTALGKRTSQQDARLGLEPQGETQPNAHPTGARSERYT